MSRVKITLVLTSVNAALRWNHFLCASPAGLQDSAAANANANAAVVYSATAAPAEPAGCSPGDR